MASNLSLLVRSGVLQRTGAQVRVAPRFLDHAEATAQRLRSVGRWLGPADALEAALGTWDEWMYDVRTGSLVLWEFMAGRGQAGALQPAFPTMDAFAVAA